MYYNHALILAMVLIGIFLVVFAWWLYRCCERVFVAEAMELSYARDVEGQKADGSGGGAAPAA
jgi:small-conductance mechanosensitive channel